MTDASWVAVGAILMALINTAGSVLLLWIRARYKWKNGYVKPTNGDVQPPH